MWTVLVVGVLLKVELPKLLSRFDEWFLFCRCQLSPSETELLADICLIHLRLQLINLFPLDLQSKQEARSSDVSALVIMNLPQTFKCHRWFCTIATEKLPFKATQGQML